MNRSPEPGVLRTPPEPLQNHAPQPENGNECFYSCYFYTKPGAPQRALAPVSQSLEAAGGSETTGGDPRASGIAKRSDTLRTNPSRDIRSTERTGPAVLPAIRGAARARPCRSCGTMPPAPIDPSKNGESCSAMSLRPVLSSIACFITPKSSQSTDAVTGSSPKLNASPPRSAPHPRVPVQIRHKRHLPTGCPPFIPFWPRSRECSAQNQSLFFAFDWCSLVPRSHNPNANYNLLKRNLPIPLNTFN